MRNSICRLVVLLVVLFISASVFAQTNEVAEGTMRSNGKIYVVLAICVTILIGLFLYIASIDRKIGKIEDKQ